MKKKEETQKISGIGSAAVQKRTGKGWDQWFAILDKVESAKKKHAEIACWLAEKYPEIGGWWCQMITVGYEQARGMRQKHQTPSGYEVNRSKTIPVPLSALYRAWSENKLRKRWLPEKITIRKATLEKSMRIIWSDNETNLSVNFYAKGKDKTLVVVQHIGLANAKEAKRMQDYWSERLSRLQSTLV